MSILRFLCRNYMDNITSISAQGREALCSLAILLGPYGLRRYSLPDRLILANGPKRGWNRFRRGRRGPHKINDQFQVVDVTNIVAAATLVDEEDEVCDDYDDDISIEGKQPIYVRTKFLADSDVHLAEDVREYLNRTDSLLSSSSETCSVASIRSQDPSFENAPSDEEFDVIEFNNSQNPTSSNRLVSKVGLLHFRHVKMLTLQSS